MVIKLNDTPFQLHLFTGKINRNDFDAFRDWMNEYREFGCAIGHVFLNGDFIVVIREAAIAFAFRLRWS